MDMKKQLDTTHVINNIEQQLLSALNKYKRHHVNISNVFELYSIKLVTWCSNFEFSSSWSQSRNGIGSSSSGFIRFISFNKFPFLVHIDQIEQK